MGNTFKGLNEDAVSNILYSVQSCSAFYEISERRNGASKKLSSQKEFIYGLQLVKFMI